MDTLVLTLIINLFVLANSVISKNAPFNITCESNSKCGNVVIENEDKFTCLTEIDKEIKKYNITQYSVRFYVEKEDIEIEGINIHHECQVILSQGCQKEAKKCYCEGNYNIFWNFSARYDRHNNVRIQARLFNSSRETIYSNILPGPRIIKDPRNSTFLLQVNNKEVLDNDKITISKDFDVSLFSIFPKELAEVLSLHYVVNDQILTSDMIIRVKPQYITIKIKLCDRELRSYNLSLHYVANQSEDIAIVIILPLVFFIMIILLLYLCWMYKTGRLRFKNISRGNKYPERESGERHPMNVDHDSKMTNPLEEHETKNQEFRRVRSL